MKQRGSIKHKCKACGQTICHNPKCKNPIIKSKARRLKCSTCRNVHYCSQECQHADWNVHKQVCFDPDTVSFFDLARKTNVACPMTKLFGCHRHPRLPMTDAQMKTCAQIYDLIRALPASEKRYRMSCQCDTLSLTDEKVKILMDTRTETGDIFIFAECGSVHCKSNPQYNPLLMLTRIKRISGEAYAAVPYYEMKQDGRTDADIHPVLINVNVDALDSERPKGFDKPTFVMLYMQNDECKCGFHHVELLPSAINEETGERAVFGLQSESWRIFEK